MEKIKILFLFKFFILNAWLNAYQTTLPESEAHNIPLKWASITAKTNFTDKNGNGPFHILVSNCDRPFLKDHTHYCESTLTTISLYNKEQRKKIQQQLVYGKNSQGKIPSDILKEKISSGNCDTCVQMLTVIEKMEKLFHHQQ